MIKSYLEKKLHELLPLYAAGRLSPGARRLVEHWLARSEAARDRLARVREIRSGLASSARGVQPPAAWPQLDVRGLAPPSGRPAALPHWRAAGMALGVLLVVFAWLAVPPALELHWSVAGAQPVEFRIYRAEGSSDDSFQLVRAIPADQVDSTYSFRDYVFVPGREYTYRIEAVGPNEVAIADQRVTGDPSLVLPGQLALLVAASVGAYGIWIYLNRDSQVRRLQPG